MTAGFCRARKLGSCHQCGRRPPKDSSLWRIHGGGHAVRQRNGTARLARILATLNVAHGSRANYATALTTRQASTLQASAATNRAPATMATAAVATGLPAWKTRWPRARRSPLAACSRARSPRARPLRQRAGRTARPSLVARVRPRRRDVRRSRSAKRRGVARARSRVDHAHRRHLRQVADDGGYRRRRHARRCAADAKW
jgi:hypothetical protein